MVSRRPVDRVRLVVRHVARSAGRPRQTPRGSRRVVLVVARQPEARRRQWTGHPPRRPRRTSLEAHAPARTARDLEASVGTRRTEPARRALSAEPDLDRRPGREGTAPRDPPRQQLARWLDAALPGAPAAAVAAPERACDRTADGRDPRPDRGSLGRRRARRVRFGVDSCGLRPRSRLEPCDKSAGAPRAARAVPRLAASQRRLRRGTGR